MNKSKLHKFADDAKKSSDKPNEPPNCISAKALDDNFAACVPVAHTGENAPYIVIQDKDGWRLDPTVDFDVCENGVLKKFRFFAMRVGKVPA
jgi:hypothetical protein